MDQQEYQRIASINRKVYDSKAKPELPPSGHNDSILERFYNKQISDIYKSKGDSPRVLDIGSGEGLMTLKLLDLGAEVTSVDISSEQLKILGKRCAKYKSKLTIRCQDVLEAINLLKSEEKHFDIIVAFSFLHHVPDYLSLIKQSIPLLSPGGYFVSFADPMKYDSVDSMTKILSAFGYYSCRILRGDILAGIKRLFRRSRGIYLDNPEDNCEYHVIRQGVDQNAISKLLTGLGFDCQIKPYFGALFQPVQFLGSKLNRKNVFAIIAKKQ
ncbi:MAG: class I SAM-dependent methyltransferase [Candidatus Saganbacteria bacterium]|nr:class I SAM-dependent methyltransferase [Candidatus Saganbacteria bacterium]